MLKQLSRLSIEAEGRYAKTEELQFLKDYLPSLDLRLSAYEKMRDAEAEIIDRLEAKMREINPNIFLVNSQDSSPLYKRDTRIILRSAAAVILINDLDRLRESMLLWHRTIIKAVKVEQIAELAHKTMPEIIQQFLTPQEFELVMPALQLNQTVLTC